VTQVAEGLTFTNGLMLGADGRRFFCNDTFVSAFVFDVQPDGTLANRRLLVEKEDVDGMALDGEGNLWITGFRSSEITRLRPDGSKLAPFPTPAGAITQVRFGGADLRDVYITAVPADGGDSLAVGELPTERRSILYRGRSDTPGAVIPPARFQLR
jgi:sugar lactone lactonase YvrE